jgi:pimeloyl-ACP methyl ester carboxylesterase
MLMGQPMYALLSICLFILALPLIGWAYQAIGAHRDRRLMAPGQLIDIGENRQVYFLEKGSGTPAVVFESGFAATSLNWKLIQDAVSEVSQTVVYDRLGLGWSSESTTDRTPTVIASELRTLLRRAGIEPPYVLVGHSFGGLCVRRFALDYPDEVAGLVLVDPMRTEEWPPVSERQRVIVNRGLTLAWYAVRIARIGAARVAVRSLLLSSGKVAKNLSRLAGTRGEYLHHRLISEVGKMPRETRPGVAAHWSDPAFYNGMLAHLNALTDTVNEMHHADPIESVPVLVLTPGSAVPLSEPALQQIGLDTRQVIAEKSRHWVHLDEPELVIAAILEMRAASQPVLAGVPAYTPTFTVNSPNYAGD